jgi:vesicle-associated membrane protein 4
MLKNTKKMGERGDHLNTLDEQVRDVSNSASLFKTGANRVRKQMWWKDMRMRMCLFVSVAILLVVIIVPSGMPRLVLVLTHSIDRLHTDSDSC